MNHPFNQYGTLLFEQGKNILSKTAVAIGAPATGAGIGILSFFEKIIPVLTVLSLIIGIILGILSYRLKSKQSKNHEEH